MTELGKRYVMTLYLYLLIAALLNIFSKAPAVIRAIKLKGKYDNVSPRDQFESNPDLKRAYAAHLNTLEAFPTFAVGMLVGIQANLDPQFLHIVGLSYIVSRIIYIWLYDRGLAWARSAVWGIGWFASLAPLFMAAF